MAIHYACNYTGDDFARYRLTDSGLIIKPWGRLHSPRRVEFICDTADEAEKLRLMIEQRCEEREALERKWELRLAEEVER